jgi:hypothetical protein
MSESQEPKKGNSLQVSAANDRKMERERETEKESVTSTSKQVFIRERKEGPWPSE